LGTSLFGFLKKRKIPDLLILISLGYSLGPISHIIDPLDLGKVCGVLSTATLIIIWLSVLNS